MTGQVKGVGKGTLREVNTESRSGTGVFQSKKLTRRSGSSNLSRFFGRHVNGSIDSKNPYRIDFEKLDKPWLEKQKDMLHKGTLFRSNFRGSYLNIYRAYSGFKTLNGEKENQIKHYNLYLKEINKIKNEIKNIDNVKLNKKKFDILFYSLKELWEQARTDSHFPSAPELRLPLLESLERSIMKACSEVIKAKYKTEKGLIDLAGLEKAEIKQLSGLDRDGVTSYADRQALSEATRARWYVENLREIKQRINRLSINGCKTEKDIQDLLPRFNILSDLLTVDTKLAPDCKGRVVVETFLGETGMKLAIFRHSRSIAKLNTELDKPLNEKTMNKIGKQIRAIDQDLKENPSFYLAFKHDLGKKLNRSLHKEYRKIHNKLNELKQKAGFAWLLTAISELKGRKNKLTEQSRNAISILYEKGILQEKAVRLRLQAYVRTGGNPEKFEALKQGKKTDGKIAVETANALLAGMGKGDPDSIDRLFDGAQWDATRLRLKLMLNDEEKWPELETRHRLNIAKREFARQVTEGTGLSKKRAFLGNLRDIKFDSAFIRALLKNERLRYQDLDLVLANALILEAKIDKKLETKKSRNDFAQELKKLGLEGGLKEIETAIDQGFRSESDRMRMARRIEAFATRLGRNKLAHDTLMEVCEQDPKVRARVVVDRILRNLTGVVSKEVLSLEDIRNFVKKQAVEDLLKMSKKGPKAFARRLDKIAKLGVLLGEQLKQKQDVEEEKQQLKKKMLDTDAALKKLGMERYFKSKYHSKFIDIINKYDGLNKDISKIPMGSLMDIVHDLKYIRYLNVEKVNLNRKNVGKETRKFRKNILKLIEHTNQYSYEHIQEIISVFGEHSLIVKANAILRLARLQETAKRQKNFFGRSVQTKKAGPKKQKKGLKQTGKEKMLSERQIALPKTGAQPKVRQGQTIQSGSVAGLEKRYCLAVLDGVVKEWPNKTQKETAKAIVEVYEGFNRCRDILFMRWYYERKALHPSINEIEKQKILESSISNEEKQKKWYLLIKQATKPNMILLDREGKKLKKELATLRNKILGLKLNKLSKIAKSNNTEINESIYLTKNINFDKRFKVMTRIIKEKDEIVIKKSKKALFDEIKNVINKLKNNNIKEKAEYLIKYYDYKEIYNKTQKLGNTLAKKERKSERQFEKQIGPMFNIVVAAVLSDFTGSEYERMEDYEPKMDKLRKQLAELGIPQTFYEPCLPYIFTNKKMLLDDWYKKIQLDKRIQQQEKKILKQVPKKDMKEIEKVREKEQWDQAVTRKLDKLNDYGVLEVNFGRRVEVTLEPEVEHIPLKARLSFLMSRDNTMRIQKDPDKGYVVLLKAGARAGEELNLSSVMELVSVDQSVQGALAKGCQLAFATRKACIRFVKALYLIRDKSSNKNDVNKRLEALKEAFDNAKQVMALKQGEISGRVGVNVGLVQGFKRREPLNNQNVKMGVRLDAEMNAEGKKSWTKTQSGSVERFSKTVAYKVGVSVEGTVKIKDKKKDIKREISLHTDKTSEMVYRCGMLTPETSVRRRVRLGKQPKETLGLFMEQNGLGNAFDATWEKLKDIMPQDQQAPDNRHFEIVWRLRPEIARQINELRYQKKEGEAERLLNEANSLEPVRLQVRVTKTTRNEKLKGTSVKKVQVKQGRTAGVSQGVVHTVDLRERRLGHGSLF